MDYETEYDLTRSVTTSGSRNYANELSKTQIYMLSGYNPVMGAIAGPPEEFPWSKDMVLIAHNMSFDWAILHRTVQLGMAPEWVLDLPTLCTADMCVYNYISRSLNLAVKAVFGEDLDKGMRNYMKGKTWQDAIDQGKDKDLLQYAKDDSYWCFKLFEALQPHFPEHEARLSEHTRHMAWRGVPFDKGFAEQKYSDLSHKRFELLSHLKWTDRRDEKYRQNYKPSSRRGLASECELSGIPVPKSMAQNDPSFLEWVDKYGEEHNFVRAYSDHYNINVHANRVKSMISRAVQDEDGNWRMSYGMKYCGADATLRFSGDAGFNVQNMPRSAKWDTNLRHLLTAPKGKTFVIADYNAIEPHLLALVLEDESTLELLRQGYNPYEASARLTMGYEAEGSLKNEDPNLYLLAKIRVLALGYGSGWHKFYEQVKDYGRLDVLSNPMDRDTQFKFGTFIKKYAKDRLEEWKTLDDDTKIHWVNAWVQVTDFRIKNPLLTKKWRQLEKDFVRSVGSDFSYELLNGEHIKYFNVRHEKNPQGYSCFTRRGEKKRSWFYGAKILENIIQREARSVFSNGLLNLIDSDYDVVMHVHDEVVVLVDEDNAEQQAEKISELLTLPPKWIGDRLPLKAEYQISRRYQK